MRRIILLLLVNLFLLFACTNEAENRQEENTVIQEARKAGKLLSGKAVGISDGDTFKLLTEENQTVRIRLYGIDAPEKKQDYGTQAKQSLSDLIYSKEVAVIQKSKDRYGRIVGVVYAGDINVNEELLREGIVWHYTDYDRSESWAALQAEAKSQKRGLWRQRNPTPPWLWRKEKREEKAVAE